MLASLRNGRATLSRLARRPSEAQRRSTRSSPPLPGLVVTNDVADRLKKAGMGRRRRAAGEDFPNFPIEPRRINVVSEALCDDIVGYLGPTIERHRGCDLVDLNPGTGIWSRKLHDFLEPRKHVMMDLDAKLYSAFLADLLAKDNVVLVPKSGLVWKDLLDTMRAQLPDQKEMGKDEAVARNDTLLVTANLTMAPKKTFKGFESLSTMIMYQIMSSIRTSTLFQRYGLVRMLFWICDEDTRRLLPRSINRRKRSSFEAEMSCDWIREVAGLDAEAENRHALRDEWINIESAYMTLERMQKQGMTMPRGRETRSYAASMARPDLMGQKLAGVRTPQLARPFKQELEGLELELADGKNTATPSPRLKYLRAREKYLNRDLARFLDLLKQHEAVSRLAASSPNEFPGANAAWNERLENLTKNELNEFNILKDSYYFFRRDPPGLFWDQRPFEPLAVTETEFFPNAPSALLDIQPKAMRPIFRQHGAGTSRSGDMSDVMLRFWFDHTLQTIPKAMESLWPGFGDLVTQCPSIRDMARGGTPMTGTGALQARAVNEEQWAEILQAWMDWPFRPSYTQVIGRMVEDWDSEADEEDMKSGAMGLGVF